MKCLQDHVVRHRHAAIIAVKPENIPNLAADATLIIVILTRCLFAASMTRSFFGGLSTSEVKCQPEGHVWPWLLANRPPYWPLAGLAAVELWRTIIRAASFHSLSLFFFFYATVALVLKFEYPCNCYEQILAFRSIFCFASR